MLGCGWAKWDLGYKPGGEAPGRVPRTGRWGRSGCRSCTTATAADPAFSAAISDLVALMGEELQQEGPRVAKLLTNKTSLDFYLLGHIHAVLEYLLEAAMRPDDATSLAATDPDFAAVRLGALFHLAFDGGLLQLPAASGADVPPSAR